MQNKILQRKRAMRTALLVLLLSAAGMGKGYAQLPHDFWAVCETGQTLWYKCLNENCVQLTTPFDYGWDDNSPYPQHHEPYGNLELPSYVTLNGVTYTVTSIGANVFEGTHLTSVIIPNTITWIGDFAFKQCIDITSITIGSSVTSIGTNAFNGCSRLVSITIPESVTSIGIGAFGGCTSLNSITICNSVVGEGMFGGCTSLTSVTFPNSVTTIGTLAFRDCIGLTSITIPVSVDTIGGAAFGGCSRLTTVYYNAQKAVAVGGALFHYITNGNLVNCPNLTTINIGVDVQEIGANIFKGCGGVHLIVALGPTPATLVGGAFADFADNSILMVSCGNKLNYFSVWNMFDFNNIMEDCSEYSIGLNNIGAGGSVSASTTQAHMGQEVQLTVTPNAGMVLSSISACNTTDSSQSIPIYPIGKGSSKYGFIMPPFGVSVMASFTTGTSVGESNSVSTAVYPNPTNGQVKIEAENLKYITISNMLGQIIYDGNASGNEFTYDFSKHKTGIYLIRIETASGVAVKKVSVTR